MKGHFFFVKLLHFRHKTRINIKMFVYRLHPSNPPPPQKKKGSTKKAADLFRNRLFQEAHFYGVGVTRLRWSETCESESTKPSQVADGTFGAAGESKKNTRDAKCDGSVFCCWRKVGIFLWKMFFGWFFGEVLEKWFLCVLFVMTWKKHHYVLYVQLHIHMYCICPFYSQDFWSMV